MNRTETITQKVSKDSTGLAGSMFVHVDHLAGKIVGVRFSNKWKDDSTMDNVLTALGDATTEIIQAIAEEAS